MHCLRRKNTWQVDPRNSWRSLCWDDDIQVRFIFYFSKLFFLSSSSKNILEHHLRFFFAVLCCCQNTSKTPNFTSMIRSFHSENPVKSWDSMPFDLLARQCCPKTCGCEIWSLKFVAVVGPLPLSFHSTMLGRSGNRQFFFNQTFFA